MRKIVYVLVAIFVLTLPSVAFASYPPHLNGDKNYIFCDGNKGVGYYVDRSSLSVKQYTPPTYIIEVNLVRVPDADMGKTTISDVMKYRFLYKYNVQEMYVSYKGSDWHFLNPMDTTYAATGLSMPAGETAFFLAYKTPFYGGKVSYFKDSFYNRITENANPVGIYYKGKPVINWLDTKSKHLWDELGTLLSAGGSPQYSQYRNYDNVKFSFNDGNGIVFIKGTNLKLFTVNGVTLDKDWAELIRMFGKPKREGKVLGGDNEDAYYIAYDYMGYSLAFFRYNPTGKAEWFDISNKKDSF